MSTVKTNIGAEVTSPAVAPAGKLIATRSIFGLISDCHVLLASHVGPGEYLVILEQSVSGTPSKAANAALPAMVVSWSDDGATGTIEANAIGKPSKNIVDGDTISSSTMFYHNGMSVIRVSALNGVFPLLSAPWSYSATVSVYRL